MSRIRHGLQRPMQTSIRVLFVDDEEEVVSTAVGRLLSRDIDAHGATSGQRALNQLMLNDFDVLVLAIDMPGMDGFYVLRQLKYVQPSTKVILLSGDQSSPDVDEGLRLGAGDCLPKPVKIEQLVEAVRRLAAKPEINPTKQRTGA